MGRLGQWKDGFLSSVFVSSAINAPYNGKILLMYNETLFKCTKEIKAWNDMTQ